MRIVRAAALACAAAFAGGGLLTQTAIVPFWRAMEPTAFLDSFATYGPATGATLVPSRAPLCCAAGHRRLHDGAPPRAGASRLDRALLCMVATVLLLPLYFGDANEAFLGRTTAVADALAVWYA